MSGVDIDAELIERLIERFGSVAAGIKDSSGNWDSIGPLCKRFGDRMDVLVGNERHLLAGLATGASGCVTATANANAKSICELFEKRRDGGAAELAQRVGAVRAIFEEYPVIAALKAFVAHATSDARWRNVRPPLTSLEPSAEAELVSRLAPLIRSNETVG
jgi:4-hydroxy-tetrahydrodipicolinate synthase